MTGTVSVDAVSSQSEADASASAFGGGLAQVGGSNAVGVVDPTITASIGQGTVIEADGSVTVHAESNFTDAGAAFPERNLLLPGGHEVLVTSRYGRSEPRGAVGRVLVSIRDTRHRAREELSRAELVSTVAHGLRAAGYRTCLAGKMHFVGPDQLHGFEERLTTDVYPSDFGWTPNWDAPEERIDWWYHNMLSVKQAGVAAAEVAA